jgi:NAD(P)-dependent dehydrogenase (short-subunit alcohol dehydrogenase family)
MLEGKVALVSGAGRGIGRSIALRFAGAGARVAAISRTRAELDAVAAAARPGTVLAIETDVSRAESVAEAVRTAREQFGEIDILVNNAAVFLHKPFTETTPEDWRRLFEINVLGAAALTREVLPAMLRRNSGRVINICSTASHRGYTAQSAYCATKHALLGLTKVLAEETRGTGVRVHAISPGGVNTAFVQVRKDVDFSEYMDPDEVAEVALFLAGTSGIATIDEVRLRRMGAEPFR